MMSRLKGRRFVISGIVESHPGLIAKPDVVLLDNSQNGGSCVLLPAQPKSMLRKNFPVLRHQSANDALF